MRSFWMFFKSELTANEKSRKSPGFNPASSDKSESERRQIKQRWKNYLKKSPFHTDVKINSRDFIKKQ